MAPEQEPVTTSSVTVTFDPASGMHIETAGVGITPDQLILASHYLRRTADQLLDAEAMRRSAVPEGIVRMASVPDEIAQLRSVGNGKGRD